MAQPIKRSAGRGFTLVELMIVVAVVSVLTALAAPRFDGLRQRARRSEVRLGLRQLAQAEKAYFAANDSYTADLNAAGFHLERGNRYAYYIALPAAHLQLRSAVTLPAPAVTDAVGADTFAHPEITAQPTEFATDGTLSFETTTNASETIPSGSVTYASKAAFLARAFGQLSNTTTPTLDAWFIASRNATVTSPCAGSNNAHVVAGEPGNTYDQTSCK